MELLDFKNKILSLCKVQKVEDIKKVLMKAVIDKCFLLLKVV